MFSALRFAVIVMWEQNTGVAKWFEAGMYGCFSAGLK